MADKPIIFSGPMVKSILDGRKTQTRRVLKNVPEPPAMDNVVHKDPKHSAPYLDSYCSQRPTLSNPRGMSHNWCWWTRDDRCCPQFKVRFAPGDLLWVRESWRVHDWATDLATIFYAANEGQGYTAMSAQFPVDGKKRIAPTPGKWRPSIHMPRWASRITLEVTAVKVERLQEISEEDILSEGVSGDNGPGQIGAFIKLWESINGVNSWEENPWVVAVTFTTHRRNIDLPTTGSAA